MALQTRLARIPEILLDLLFPRKCIGCGAEGEFICSSCNEELPRLESPYCESCGLPLEEKGDCPKCRNRPLEIDGIRSLFLHEGLARDAVHSLKYNNLKSLTKPLAQLMAEYLESNPLPADILQAIPMHSKRMRERGYNQAHLLAKELGRLMQLPVSLGILIRTTNTPSQVSLGAEERRKNVAGAFRCKNQAFAGQRVLLIDDVCTTGD
jgi:ComF family protein